MRILIAAMGNSLRGDDGFGIAVARRLAEAPLPSGIEILEAGGDGMAIAQKLLEGFDACVLVDALVRGAEPGTVSVIDCEDVPGDVDPHVVDPLQAVTIARALGATTRCVLVGCEPRVMQWGEGLSPVVETAIPEAVARALSCCADFSRCAEQRD